MSKKPSRLPEVLEVIYSAEHWTLLKGLREKAFQFMDALQHST
ncbi:MAG: hypothetical protein ACPLW5_06675 [Candidatus Bathyarchaeales archaeon]